MAAAKKAEIADGRCGASSGHITKLKQTIFFRYLWIKLIGVSFPKVAKVSGDIIAVTCIFGLKLCKL